MARYYDDNFGWFHVEDEDDLRFYHQMQAENVEKICEGCGRRLMLRPSFAYCNSCVERMEKGYDIA